MSAWMSEDGDFIGVTGVNSIEEMAAAIREDSNQYGLDAFIQDLELDEEWVNLETWLVQNGARAMGVSQDTFEKERWDSSEIAVLNSLDEEPPYDFIKVLGVNF